MVERQVGVFYEDARQEVEKALPYLFRPILGGTVNRLAETLHRAYEWVRKEKEYNELLTKRLTIANVQINILTDNGGSPLATTRNTPAVTYIRDEHGVRYDINLYRGNLLIIEGDGSQAEFKIDADGIAPESLEDFTRFMQMLRDSRALQSRPPTQDSGPDKT